MSMLVADLLRARIRTTGADPLITYYDVPRRERVELSGVTFANWMSKTANLLTWEVSVSPGDAVALPLGRTAPGHWMTAVWQLAIWEVGAYVDLSPEATDSDVLVCGPDWQPYAAWGGDVLACSLHPFASGLGAGLPASVTDVDLAVRAQPDSHPPGTVAPTALAWVDDRRRLTQADLVGGPGSGGRTLIVPGEAWETARDGLVAALIGGGSMVVVLGGSPDDLEHIRVTELVEG